MLYITIIILLSLLARPPVLFCNHEVPNGIFSIDFETANDYRIAHAQLVLTVYSLIKPAKMYFRPDFHRHSWNQLW